MYMYVYVILIFKPYMYLRYNVLRKQLMQIHSYSKEISRQMWLSLVQVQYFVDIFC